VIYISDHTNNGQPRLAFSANPDSFSDCFIVWPISVGKSLINDHDVRLPTGVAIIKLTPLQEWNSHRAEVVWQDSPKTNARCFARSERHAFNVQFAVWVTTADRQSIHRTDGVDSR
jgi:hypothetical protein